MFIPFFVFCFFHGTFWNIFLRSTKINTAFVLLFCFCFWFRALCATVLLRCGIIRELRWFAEKSFIKFVSNSHNEEQFSRKKRFCKAGSPALRTRGPRHGGEVQ